MQNQENTAVDFVINEVVQRFVKIEPGTFVMGSPEDEPERFADESQHEVTIDQGFWMADTVVTQALWQSVMGNNPSYFKDDPQNPVENVSWNDAVKFIAKLNELYPEYEFDLPTEEEWEYACRAGTTAAFNTGNTITTDQANFDGAAIGGVYRGHTVPVKSFPPNDWGLYEMHGNVWEWTKSDYKEQNE